MAIQTLIKSVGGTIETYFEAARPASVTVTLYTDTGSKKVDGVAGSVDSVSTTVSSAVSANSTTVALSSASGVVSGRRYILGTTGSTAPQEVVTVKSLSASTATLFAPTAYAHNSGDAFRCGRVTYTVSSTSADAVWYGGWADFAPDSGDTQTETVDCALRKIPDNLLDKADLLQVFPKGQKMLDAELDLPKALREARDQFLVEVGGKVRVHQMYGAQEFKRGAALTFWLLRRYSFGDEWQPIFEQMSKDREREMTKLQAQIPVDTDNDSTTDGPFDHNFVAGLLNRA